MPHLWVPVMGQHCYRIRSPNLRAIHCLHPSLVTIVHPARQNSAHLSRISTDRARAEDTALFKQLTTSDIGCIMPIIREHCTMSLRIKAPKIFTTLDQWWDPSWSHVARGTLTLQKANYRGTNILVAFQKRGGRVAYVYQSEITESPRSMRSHPLCHWVRA